MPVNDPTRFDALRHKALSLQRGGDRPSRESKLLLPGRLSGREGLRRRRGASRRRVRAPIRTRSRRSECGTLQRAAGSLRSGTRTCQSEGSVSHLAGDALYSCGDAVLGWDATESCAADQEVRRVRPSYGQRRRFSGQTAMVAAGAGGRSGSDLGRRIPPSGLQHSAPHCDGPVYCLSFSPRSTKLVAAGARRRRTRSGTFC